MQDPVARRRTFAIISHPDAGKTTLTEKLLLFGGAIQLAGEVRAKANRRQTPLRLDGHRARARHFGGHLGDDVRIWRLRLQPARHARPRGFHRRHLPHADRRRFRRHGDRRGERASRRARESCSKSAACATFPSSRSSTRWTARPATRSTSSTKSRRRWLWRLRRSHGPSAAAAASPAPTIFARSRLTPLGKNAESYAVNGPDDPRVAELLARARARDCDRGVEPRH